MIAVVDTCVIIDYLQGRQPFFSGAKRVFLAAANKRFEGFVTAKAITDIYYLMHRSFHNADRTKNAVRAIMTLFSVADTLAEDSLRALDSGIADYEDALMVESAKRIGADCIITRNEKDYMRAGIPIYDPEAFISLLDE